MAFVGIDQSYTGFGLVVINASTQEVHNHLGKFDAAKHGKGTSRLLEIEDWLAGHLRGWDIDWICMEGYANGAKFGREQAGELGYAVKRTLAKHPQSLAPTVVPPTSLKKYVTGKGNAKKNEMLLAVYKRWGVEYDNDNLADAYSLAQMAIAINTPDTVLTGYQRDVLAALN